MFWSVLFIIPQCRNRSVPAAYMREEINNRKDFWVNKNKTNHILYIYMYRAVQSSLRSIVWKLLGAQDFGKKVAWVRKLQWKCIHSNQTWKRGVCYKHGSSLSKRHQWVFFNTHRALVNTYYSIAYFYTLNIKFYCKFPTNILIRLLIVENFPTEKV